MPTLRVGGGESGEEGVGMAAGLRGRHLHLDVDGLHPVLAEAEKGGIVSYFAVSLRKASFSPVEPSFRQSRDYCLR